jgi:glycerol-3-phosphate acyltransferase PlsY
VLFGLFTLALLIAGSYLIGAIPFGYLVARARGVDILKMGSGNIGATNVSRVLGRGFGIPVFLLDFAKGAVPVWVAGRIAVNFPADSILAWGRLGEVSAGLAAFLGHLYPVYLKFRGGKGVATGAGVVAELVPHAALAGLTAWVATMAAIRYVSVSSIVAAIVLVIAHLLGTSAPFAGGQWLVSVFCLVAAILVIARHRANIARLREGSEHRIEQSPRFVVLTKAIHVISLGVWFGSNVFFVIAAPGIFGAFQDLGWLPLPANLPADQAARRLAGIAIEPLFAVYFLLLAICAALALGTALGWRNLESPRSHRRRLTFIAVAILSLMIGWPIADHVGELRIERYSSEPNVARAADLAFGTWHAASLGINFVTLISSGAALALASQLPVPSDSGSVPRQSSSTISNHVGGAASSSGVTSGHASSSGMISDHAGSVTEGLQDPHPRA